MHTSPPLCPLDVCEKHALLDLAADAFCPPASFLSLVDRVESGELTFAEFPEVTSGQRLKRLVDDLVEEISSRDEIGHISCCRLVAAPGQAMAGGSGERGSEQPLAHIEADVVTLAQRYADFREDIGEAADGELLDPQWVRHWTRAMATELRYLYHARQASAVSNPRQHGAA